MQLLLLLVGTGGVQDVEGKIYAPDREVSVVHLLHGSLVLRREAAVQELGDERAFAHLGRTHHHDLVAHVGVYGIFIVVQPHRVLCN
uniref:Putative secreted protein n=1 Tax=Anopheles darlingi TaxID=43151 RepID=A0A2M4DAK8_ANODA